MADEDRHRTDALKSVTNGADVTSFAFFPLVALIEHLYPDAPRVGSTTAPEREAVRFRATPTLGFPPSELSAIRPLTPDGDRHEILVNLLGLHGPSSPLPPSYTERIVHAEGAGALGDFFDFFNHRLVSLLAQIWKHYRHHIRYIEGAQDPISMAVGALFGLLPREDHAEALEWRVRLLPYGGVLSLYSRSARMVAEVLSDYLEVPCAIEEFVPRQIDIPQEAQWTLGAPGLALGVNTIAGESMADVTGKFRVRLGPLTAEQFRALLPGREAHAELSKLIGLALKQPLAWDLVLELAPGAAPQCVLGQAELGWTSLLDASPHAAVSVQL